MQPISNTCKAMDMDNVEKWVRKVIVVIAGACLVALAATTFLGAVFNANVTGIVVTLLYGMAWCWYFRTRKILNGTRDWNSIHDLYDEACSIWRAFNIYLLSWSAILNIGMIITQATRESNFSVIQYAQDGCTAGVVCLSIPLLILLCTFMFSIKKR